MKNLKRNYGPLVQTILTIIFVVLSIGCARKPLELVCETHARPQLPAAFPEKIWEMGEEYRCFDEFNYYILFERELLLKNHIKLLNAQCAEINR